MIDFPRIELVASSWALQLLTHLWQSTIVALGILLLLFIGGRLSARTRRTLGWIAIAKFAVPATWLAGVASYFIPAPKTWLASDVLMLPVRVSSAELASSGPAAAWSAPTWAWPAFVAMWIAGSVGLLAWWIFRAVRSRRQLLRGARPIAATVESELLEAARRVGLRSAPRCATVATELSPGAVGIVSPILILPAGLGDSLPRSELSAILIHECVHVQRRDNFWNAVRSVFAALLWFNPIVWLVNRVIAIETEKSCDDRVLEITGDAETYASSIVASVRHTLGVVPSGLSAVTTPPVLARIHAILAHHSRRDRPLARWAAIVAGISLVAFSGRTGSLAAAATPPTPAPTATNQPTVLAAVPKEAERKAPTHKVGTIQIRFTRASGVTEESVRDRLQLRTGDAFDETVIDQKIRLLYRTGWFETVEIKTEPAGGDAVNLLFELKPKALMPGIVFDGIKKPGTIDSSLRESVTSGDPDERVRALEQELKRAQLIVEEANAELKRMRDERAVVVAKQKEIADAEAKAAAAAAPPRVEPAPPPARIVLNELLPRPAATVPALPDPSMVPPLYKGMRVFETEMLDQKPAPKFQARPRYPFEMRRNGIGGEVVVDFIIDTEGNVVNARAIRSTREVFEPAAVHAVSNWKFKPGRKGGRNVPTHMQVPIVFTLEEK